MNEFLVQQGLLTGAAAATGLSIIALGVATIFFPALAPQLPTLIGGLTATFGILAGGDFAHKWTVSKAVEPVEPLPPQ